MKHAGGGELIVRGRSRTATRGHRGPRARPRGRAWRTSTPCLRDGHSTAGSAGHRPRRDPAPGRLRRPVLARPARDGVIVARGLPSHERAPLGATGSDVGRGLRRRCAGEEVCGDAWCRVGPRRGGARSWSPTGSATARGRRSGPRPPSRLLRGAPRRTPAAIARAAARRAARARAAPPSRSPRIDPRARHGPLRRRRQHRRARSSRRATADAAWSRTTARSATSAAASRSSRYPWPAGALLVMHSDGLGAPLGPRRAIRALRRRASALVAGVLYRDFQRGARRRHRRGRARARRRSMSVAAPRRWRSATSRTWCCARQRARQIAGAARLRRRRTRRASPPRSPRSRATPSSTPAAAGRVPRRRQHARRSCS